MGHFPGLRGSAMVRRTASGYLAHHEPAVNLALETVHIR
jgi:hypothetical protein